MKQNKFHRDIPNNADVDMSKEYTTYDYGDSLGDALGHAMKKETIPSGICKCKLIFAKAGQTDIWVWLTWGGYAELAGIGETHNGKLSFVVINDGEKNIALPTDHQEEPFSIRGILVPALGDVSMWQKLFSIEDERPTMEVQLNGSTLKKVIDIEESHHEQ